MGQTAWISKSDGFANFSKHHISELPAVTPLDELPRESMAVPVGLNNLGATCYLNSLLQIWFSNMDLRRLVFDNAPNDAQSVLYHLANVFARLQLSAKRSITPDTLIRIMELDVAIQQDALEFSKLFLSILESAMPGADQPDTFANPLVRLMQGRHAYVTRCNNCKNESTTTGIFHELEIDITESSVLTDGITKYLADEHLTGEDQYMCSRCNSKHDASRCIQLVSLPKAARRLTFDIQIVNFQINRFRFDPKAMIKKKVNKPVHFPEQIDLSAFLTRHDGAACVYKLQAALLHKGFSANSGHYIAHTYSAEHSSWFEFDDQTVKCMEKPSFHLPSDDAFLGSTKSSKTSAAKDQKMHSTVVDPVTKQRLFSSTSVYMLTYVKCDEDGGDGVQSGTTTATAGASKERALSSASPTPVIPLWLRDQVTAENADFTFKVEQSKQRDSEMRLRFDAQLSRWKDVFSSWTISNDQESCFYVSAAALAAVVQHQIAPHDPPAPASTPSTLQSDSNRSAPQETDDKAVVSQDPGKNGTETKPDCNTVSINNGEVLCEHGKLHPAKVWMTKRISKVGYHRHMSTDY
eukprot:jgi/Hompol1/6046/HPOL_004819-RA